MSTTRRIGLTALALLTLAVVVPAADASSTRRGGSRSTTTSTTSTTVATTSTTSTTAAPPTTTSTTSTTAAPATTTTTAPPGGLLWRTNYDSLSNLDDPTPAWQVEQEPHSPGANGPSANRVTIVDGSHGRVMRVELRPFESAVGLADGDIQNSSGYLANRAEVYSRFAANWQSPADQWPDPVYSTRWYGFDLFVPNDFATDPTGLVWFSLIQWKGVYGGQPAIALEIKRENIEMAGASARNNLGPLKKGQWERIVIGVHFDPTNAGWVEVYRDGTQALPRTYRPTTQLATVGGQQINDPTYLKQGIYRDPRWTITHVLQYGPTSIGLNKSDVL